MVFADGQFNGVISIYLRPTLVAVATKFELKFGYNSAYMRDISDILAFNPRWGYAWGVLTS